MAHRTVLVSRAPCALAAWNHVGGFGAWGRPLVSGASPWGDEDGSLGLENMIRGAVDVRTGSAFNQGTRN